MNPLDDASRTADTLKPQRRPAGRAAMQSRLDRCCNDTITRLGSFATSRRSISPWTRTGRRCATRLATVRIAARPDLSAGDRRRARRKRRSSLSSLNPSDQRADRRHASAMAEAKHVEQAVRAATRGAAGVGGARRRAARGVSCAPRPTCCAAAVRARRLGSLRMRQAVARGRRRCLRGDRLLRVLRRWGDRAGSSRRRSTCRAKRTASSTCRAA